MAEHKRPKTVSKAKRGGFSLSGFRVFQERTQMRQRENRNRDVRSSMDDPSQRSEQSGPERNKGNPKAPRSPTKQKPPTDTQKTLFDVEGNNGVPQSAPRVESLKKLGKHPVSSGENEDALDAEEDATALLSRFLRSTSRSNSRPGSSGTWSGGRNSPHAANPLKRSADGLYKDDRNPLQGLSTPVAANTNGNVYKSVSPNVELRADPRPQLTSPINIPNTSMGEKIRSPRAELAPRNTRNRAPSFAPPPYSMGPHIPSSEGPSITLQSNNDGRKGPMQPFKAAESVEARKRRIVVLQVPKREPTKQSVVKEQEQFVASQSSLSPSKHSVMTSSNTGQSTIPPAPENSSPGPVRQPSDAGFTRTHRPMQQRTTNIRKDQFSPSPPPEPATDSFTSPLRLSPISRISPQPGTVESSTDMPPKRTPKVSARNPRRSQSTSTPQSPPIVLDSGVRRSRRNRAGPANYFAPRPGFRGHSESVDEELPQSPAIAEPRQKESPAPEPSRHVRKQGKQRVRYRTDEYKIIQQPLDSSEYTFKDRVPYFPVDYIRDLSKKWWVGIRCGIFHVDFTRAEIVAVHSIVVSDPPDEDSPIQDLTVKAVQKVCHSPKDVDRLAAQIKELCRASALLEPYSDQLKPLLLEYRQGDFSRSSATSRTQMKKLCKYLSNALSVPLDSGSSVTICLQRLLQNVSKERVERLADQLLRAKDLRYRKQICLQAFLEDARKEAIPTSPSIYQLLPLDDDAEWDTISFDQFNAAALLRSRETGYKVHRGSTAIQRTLKSVTTKWEMYKSWKGASHDVLELCWSPDGTRFAAAAAAQCDEHNMLYNRNNNLILGDLASNRLKELPGHRVPRPPSTQHVNTTIDPNLYMTVTAAKWSRHTDRLFTSSYDQTVKIWDVQAHLEAVCINTIQHPGKIHVMALSDGGQIATGCEDSCPFRVWNVSANGNLTEISAGAMGKEDMMPSSLAWAFPRYGENYLAAGMSGRDAERSRDPPRNGHLAVWKVAESHLSPISVTPSSQNIFDVRWHPTLPVLATASTMRRGLNKHFRSLVRIYDPTRMKSSSHEFECPALDMNDVAFCPHDNFYVSANCTDGATYVWDFRKPGQILHKLKHAAPISPLDPDLTREQADVGVRLALWGDNTTQLYTGSSDGVLKLWNILRAREDVLVSNVHTFGHEITCGAFSPDMSNMLVGDAGGSVHVLSNAPWSRAQDGDTSLVYEPSSRVAVASSNNVDEEGEEEEGGTAHEIVQEMFSTGKIIRHPLFGAMQGPNYDGPFASWARTDSVGNRDLSKLTERARNQQLKKLPLNQDVKSQQFYGPPIESRRELDKATREYVGTQMQLAEYRNKIRGQNKRKREPSPLSVSEQPPPHKPASKDIIEISSGDEEKVKTPKSYSPKKCETPSSRQSSITAPKLRKVVKREVPSPKRPGTKIEVDFIDLTMSDSDTKDEPLSVEGLGTTQPTDALDEDPDDPFEEDHWWPTNIDPNL